jgi:N-acetylgalactosamine-6-sulfatase
MKRHRGRTVWNVALVGAMLLAAFCPAPAAPAEPGRPNILFIFADDWGWGDLGCHGHPYVKTPNIDRLAAQGTDFQRFTVASGVCSPSRAAVMTGQFPARYNIDGHFAWAHQNAKRNMPDWLDPRAPLLPRFLQQAGYATAHYGKWHLANDMIPDSPLPSQYGYDDYGAFNCTGEQMPVHEDALSTIAFIEKSHHEGKPFFINLWIHEPHTPFHVVPKYRWRFPDLAEADNIYASVLSHADDRIGKVLDALDRWGLAESTLVIFSSDNGPARAARPTGLDLMYDTATGAGFGIGASRGITGGRKGYKGALFEGGIGVPFIARWPGRIPAGKIDNVSLISAVDLLPTFCEVAGAKLPSSYTPDGVSQLGTLEGKVSPSRQTPLFWKFDAPWPALKHAPDHWVSYAVVDQHWKLVANADSSYCELYDIAASPAETNDVKKTNPEVVERLLGKLAAWKTTLPSKPNEACLSAGRSTS